MAYLKFCRSILENNWICGHQTVLRRRISSSSSSSSGAPWLLIEDSVDEEDECNKLMYNFYNVGEKKVESLKKMRGKGGIVAGSSHGWLALYKLGQDLYTWRRRSTDWGFEMFLYNPISRRSVNLPSVNTLSETRTRNFNPDSTYYIRHRPKKVILSSSPEDEREDEECVAIMSFGAYHSLAYWSPRRSACWIPIVDGTFTLGYPPTRIYEDFVYSSARKKLFCVTKCDKFECWDFRDTLSPTLDWKMDFDAGEWCAPKKKKDFCRTLKYLVVAENSDRLFLVWRHVMERYIMGKIGDSLYYTPEQLPYRTYGFDVYELIVDGPDKKGGKPTTRYMEATLDGMAFFIGSTGHGFVVEPNEDDDDDKMIKNNVEPNSIYFTDPKELTPLLRRFDDRPGINHGGHDLGIFNYENETFSSCYYPCDARSIRRRIEPTPTWFTTSLHQSPSPFSTLNFSFFLLE